MNSSIPLLLVIVAATVYAKSITKSFNDDAITFPGKVKPRYDNTTSTEYNSATTTAKPEVEFKILINISKFTNTQECREGFTLNNNGACVEEFGTFRSRN